MNRSDGRALLAAAAAAALALACGGESGSADGGARGAAQGADPAPDLTVLFQVDSLERPESAAWDAGRERWLITNIVGGSSDEDGNGYVTAVSPDGREVRRRAMTGETLGTRLDGPKGIVVRGDRAWMADIHRVIGVDLTADTAAFDLEIPGSGFLNDVALGGDGAVYVSDTEANAVWRVSPDGRSYGRVGAVGSLRSPNGLLADPRGDGLLVAAWEGALLALDPDSSVTLLAEPRAAENLDGIQAAPGGGVLISDFSRGTVSRLSPRKVGRWEEDAVWLKGLTTPADFQLRDSVLALPQLQANRATFYRVGASGADARGGADPGNAAGGPAGGTSGDGSR